MRDINNQNANASANDSLAEQQGLTQKQLQAGSFVYPLPTYGQQGNSQWLAPTAVGRGKNGWDNPESAPTQIATNG